MIENRNRGWTVSPTASPTEVFLTPRGPHPALRMLSPLWEVDEGGAGFHIPRGNTLRFVSSRRIPTCHLQDPALEDCRPPESQTDFRQKHVYMQGFSHLHSEKQESSDRVTSLENALTRPLALI
jgi:hypothetical protein